jgi:hypothetical protein
MADELKSQDLLGRLYAMSRFVFSPFTFIWKGYKTNRLPWGPCALVSLGLFGAVLLNLDRFLFQASHLYFLYPVSPALRWTYCLLLTLSPLWIWGLIQAAKFNHWRQRLEIAFLSSGLKNRLGKTPLPVRHFDLDPFNSKWIVTSANFPLSEFRKAKDHLEASLKIYIDEFREDRAKGLVTMNYSAFPMPSNDTLRSFDDLKSLGFFIGITRSKRLKGSFKDTPHLLVAGQTGGGKSTFLRQLILGLLCQTKICKLSLIDLKGGLEFQLFEDLPRVTVCGGMSKAVQELCALAEMLGTRLEELKRHKTKDLDALEQKMAKVARVQDSLHSENRQQLSKGLDKQSSLLTRHIVVVDEAAEIFLAGGGASAADVMKARKAMSLIARQGRAVGIHLVIATQRPDAKAVDPQVKANLTGVLCFQMMNDSSSIAVLGNGRATDLSAIPGRALWKSGLELVEVQTPFLAVSQAESIIERLKSAPTTKELCNEGALCKDRTPNTRSEHSV